MLAKKEIFIKKFKERFIVLFGKTLDNGTLQEKYTTLASLVRDEISKDWVATNQAYLDEKAKKVYYFSIEFLPGKFLMNNLLNLGMKDMVEETLEDLGIDLEELKDQEEDPGLGNGGLGRLAAAFLDSLAALGMAGYGNGIRYRYGLFEQKFINGRQVELADNWLRNSCVWEYKKPQEAEKVKYGGHIRVDSVNGRVVFTHENYENIRAVPYDIPITGYQNNTVNILRLWSAEAKKTNFEFHTFCRGEYAKAFEHKAYSESISQVLYPDDSTYEGRMLRLKQQYFFVSAGLQSIIRQYKKENQDMWEFHKKVAVHINDTHPALAIPELMRILIDEESMGWDEAWKITVKTISYTNHTILPEALEKWPIDLFQHLLPRIYMIIEEINSRFCRDVMNKYPKEPGKVKALAIIADGFVRMANLSIVGSHSVNGVAELHTEILKNKVMNNFNNFFPDRFNNKTNGITHRRWILLANPKLGKLITDTIGPEWIDQPVKLDKLTAYAQDASFQKKIATIKYNNKKRLASFIYQKYGIFVDPASIFDIQIKRIHGYKRQLLNILHIMHLYNCVRENLNLDIVPRTFIFGGKAAPAYYLAKRVIKLINTMADMINNDHTIKDKIKVVFLENYNVSLAELAFPSADVSEQISTASKEASGTGNMKFIMNGAVTIGTLDGANIEIREQVGADNFIAFGISAEEVLNFYQFGGYSSWEIYRKDPRVKKVCDQLIDGFLPQNGEFQALYDHLLYHNDEFFVLKDFASYVDAQQRLEKEYRNSPKWISMCIYNISYSGMFSSDRTINEYAKEIWKIKPVDIKKQRNKLNTNLKGEMKK